MKPSDLFLLVREFRTIVFTKNNYYALGQSQVVLEAIRERLEVQHVSN